MTLEAHRKVGPARARAALQDTIGADLSCCTRMMPGDTHNVRGHCASALTHPVTIAALVLLLLNDALFKSLWPDSWVTGKLSDLAWVVFASPLLAFVLSLFLGHRPFNRRATIIIAYVGLPALYAAFNTFEPVHDGIIWGLSLVAGGTAGSPLDPTDSLVIPFGLGIAWWVWRRRAVGPGRLRVRLALLAAGVATFATVATSPQVDIGITNVGVARDGAFVAATPNKQDRLHYRSADGGLTWLRDFENTNIKWGSEKVDTRRGKYMIQGSDVLVLTVREQWRVVFSAARARSEANTSTQESTSTQSGQREIAAQSHSIVYDERSGNLIVAMGLQGVLVGTPDGQWSQVAVDRYSPRDSSSFIETRSLNSAAGLVANTLPLSVSMMAVALLASQHRRESLQLGIGIALATLTVFLYLRVLSATTELSDEAKLAMAMVLMVALLGSAIYLGSGAKDTNATRALALALAIFCVIVSGASLESFDVSADFPTIFSHASFATLVVIVSIAAMRIPWRQLRHRKAVIVAIAGMNGLAILVILMWVQLGFDLAFAKVSAFVLVALVAIALTTHLKRKQQPG